MGFGTSGLRGLASGFTPDVVGAYVRGFLQTSCADADTRDVAIGVDLRASSPAIAALVAGAVAGSGWRPIHGGAVPTPALAAYALKRGIPAIMVTGSHIPPDYNGLKFYRPDGELLKSDEAPIAAAAEETLGSGWSFAPADLPPVEEKVAVEYTNRFTSSFSASSLSGLRVGVFAHSAVGRDLLADILESLGADCVCFGRVEEFVAVDTEAASADHLDQMRQALKTHGLDAVVSTDGDGDRPLLLDEAGHQINGDVLGALTARFLGAKTVVTPLTSTSGIELSGWFETVIRTRIGSPFVVEAMTQATTKDEDRIVGFEANGGFLVQTPFSLEDGILDPLPTRDAVLPILAVLASSKSAGEPISHLAASLPPRVMKAARLKEIPPQKGSKFCVTMADSFVMRTVFDPILSDISAIDTTDGTRLTLTDGSIVHFRQSGNAPELRCYVETDTAEATDRLLETMMAQLEQHFGRKE
ncbi:MAG TPA: phosphomannomutase [Pelagibacterium sp.]|uniref:phosphomannomutase n=1 Tax=uncultured Pelagibacterium sp. TaxID=1159875 RepID=UPI000EC04BE0|nr:phosphomannomutase [Pelagibacterium sp.]